MIMAKKKTGKRPYRLIIGIEGGYKAAEERTQYASEGDACEAARQLSIEEKGRVWITNKPIDISSDASPCIYMNGIKVPK